jgi:hypothetical protein
VKEIDFFIAVWIYFTSLVSPSPPLPLSQSLTRRST